MTLTTLLKDFLMANCGLAKEAPDDDIRKAALDAIANGSLPFEKFTELTTPEATEAEKRIQKSISDAVAPLTESIGTLGKLLEKMTANAGTDGASATDTATKAANTAANSGPDPAKAYQAAGMANADGSGDGTEPDHEKAARVRLKSVVEQFDDVKSSAVWTKYGSERNRKFFGDSHLQNGSGDDGTYGGRYLDMPTERSKAIAGAWLTHMVGRAYRSKGMPVPRRYQMNELNRKLVEYAVHECRFVGPVDWDDNDDEATFWFNGMKVTNDLHKKALLDDSTSGGLEAVPIEFDDNAIITPLLTGELFPYVNLVNVGRRRIEATAFGNPTMSWGTAEGSQISLFDTDSFISAFDNTIYPITGAFEIGLDFLADSPLNVGQVIVQRYGERMRQELDNAIASGNGTNRPQGIENASGTTSVTSDNGASGPPTPDDYLDLLKGVTKEYRQEARAGGVNRAIFIGTEASYFRFRGMKVDPAATSTDERWLWGNNIEDYMALGHRFAINESLDNTDIIFACMNRYRMYRRQGFEVRVTTEGKELVRKNQEMIAVRARFGGKLELGGAAAITTTAQS